MITPDVDFAEPQPRLAPVTRPHAVALLREMLRIRRFEERCAEHYSAGDIRGFLHLGIGEEALYAGAVAALAPTDPIYATYREHGHALARGVDPGRVMAEMFGKVEGVSRGRGGSMHLFDVAHHLYGGNAIVAGHLPLAVGHALASHRSGGQQVTACFFGEGAIAEGEFHEAVNLATLWQLPVLFCCENNLYAMGTALARSESQTDLAAKAASYGLPSEAVDAMDVLAVEAAVGRAATRARGGSGPSFLELRTYRFRAHSMYDAQLYRDRDEVKRWKQGSDPIDRFAAALRAESMLDDADLAKLERGIEAELDGAVALARAGHDEDVADLCLHVLSPPVAPEPPSAPVPHDGSVVSGRDAVALALREALDSDPRVFLMGEDVGAYGGCYAVTKGFLDAYGPDRIRDTPLSEAGFTGAGVGAALGGQRPIVEIMTVNFSLLALDQILNNAATLRHMSGGQLSVPLVIRMATGGGRQVAAQHSHSLEGWYAHIPGLKVLVPGCVADLRGMLWTALQDPDPVLIFEHVGLYTRDEVLAADAGPVDIERAVLRRTGADVVLVTFGGSLPKALDAAEVLAQDGIDAGVLDLRVLRPLDEHTLLAAVRATGRAVVIDEGWRTGSFAAEICARLAEHAFYDLEAPLERVCTVEVPIPYPAHLEQAALPQVADIVAAARRAMRGEG